MGEQNCTLIVGREHPEGVCGAPAVGIFTCTTWNAYRLRAAPGDAAGFEIATGKPVALCAGHRAGHLDWPVIQEFATPCDDGTEWHDVGDALAVEGGTLCAGCAALDLTTCGDVVVIADVAHTCTRDSSHVVDAPHGDGDIEWPVAIETPVARGGGKPRRG